LLHQLLEKVLVEVSAEAFSQLKDIRKIIRKIHQKDIFSGFSILILILTVANSLEANASDFLLETPLRMNLICQMMALGSWNWMAHFS